MEKRFRFRRVLSFILVLSLMMGIMTPMASADDVDSKWKFVKLVVNNENHVLSLSNYAKREAQIVSSINPEVFSEEQDYDMQMELSFSIQYSQPMRIEIYTLKDGIEPKDVSLASGGEANLDAYDPRGEFVGYVYGEYEDSKRAFDGDMDSAQKFVGFDGEPPEGYFNTFSLNDVGFEYNSILWKGYVVAEGAADANEKFLIGSTTPGVENYVIVVQPVAEKTKVFPSFLPLELDYSTIPENYTVDNLNEYKMTEDGIVADPVNIVTGNMMWDYTDIALYGADTLGFTRNYSSRNQSVGELGKGWLHNYSYSLEEHDLYTIVTMSNGYTMTFMLNYDGSFTPPKGCQYSLAQTGDGFVLTAQDLTEYRFNASGSITGIVPVNGLETNFAYSNGRLASVSNRTGTLTFAYSGDKLASVSDDTGRSAAFGYSGDFLISATNTDADSLEYSYDANGYLASVRNFIGEIYMENEYDENGCIIRQYLADEGTSYFSYDFVAHRNTFTSPSGETTVYYYDNQNNITAIENTSGTLYRTFEDGVISSKTDRLGNTTYYSYDAEGNQNSITHPDGTIERYTYNSLNLVTEHVARDGSVTRYGYDTRGNLTSYTDAKGNVSSFEYDADNNLTLSRDALGNETRYTYDSKGNCLSTTDPLGNTMTNTYDEQGRLVLTTYPDGSTVQYEYTTAGKLVKTTDPDGNESSYTVNGNGYDEGTADPMGNTTSTVYNEQNRPISVTDAEGNTTSYEYDEAGSLVKTTDALGGSTSYSYDALGRMTSMTDARGNTWSYSYDAEGRVTATSNPLNHSTSTVYDSMGRTTTSTNARGAKTSYTYDNMGRTTQVTDALGGSSRNVYDANGNLVEQYDKNGNKWSYEYDANNRMVKATDPLGFVTSYEYDANGQATKTVSSLGAQVKSVYDNMGRLVTSIDPEGNETGYSYDILGRLVKVTYSDGTFTSNEYNANSLLVKSIAQDGGETSYTYNRRGQILTITDALGGVIKYAYDALGRTTFVTDALDGVTAYVYDANGNLLTVTDALGNVTSYMYDKLNRVKKITDAHGGVTLTEYDANGNVTKVTNPDGGVITYSYDLLDRLTSYTDAEGYTFSFTYDANGNTLTSTDARGNTGSTAYDALNRAISSTDAAGGVTSVTYDADGRVIKTTNAEGAETNYLYDLNGNITKVTDALGNATTFTYDSMNRVVTMTDANGAVTTYTYTAMGYTGTITDALDGVVSYEYDLLGRLVKETNELGKSTTYTYDALGRVLSTTNALGNTDTFTYDALGRIKTVTDKNGNVTRYNYDANGNVVETIDALEGSSYFEYDAMNRLVKVTLNRIDTQDKVNEQQVTLYQYDKRGLTTKEINAAGGETLYVYDGNGNLVQKTDADGHVTEYSYDPRNLVEAINYSDGKEVLFAYNANGELVAMMDWNGVTSFELDLLGRITSVNDHNDKTTSYTYDAVGNQTSMTYPDNTVVRYSYDLLGRMTNMRDAEGQNTVYAYNAASQLITQAYPNGWNETYTYDAVGQLLTQVSSDPTNTASKTITHKYTYDANGNILTEYRSGAGGQDRFNLVHSYDALNRLTKTTGDQGYKTHEYTYDSLGNLTYEKIHNKGTDYKYNVLNQQIQKILDGKDTYNYTFDNRGNLIRGVYAKKNAVVEQYVYDSTNRMVKGVNADGEQSHYIYNGLGYLVGNEWIIAKNAYGYHGVGTTPSEQVDGVVAVCTAHKNTSGNGHQNPTGAGHFKDKGETNDGGSTTGGTDGGVLPTISNKQAVVHKDYVLDYTSALKDVILETESGDGGLTYRYVYGLQKVETVITGNLSGSGSLEQNGQLKLYYHHDHLGSTDYLTDNVDGKVVSYVTYDDWGAPTAKAVLRCGVRELDLVLEYTGHPYDQVIGLYFAEARMYDAADRRFMAVDWVKGSHTNPQTYDMYTYVLNNPLQFVDPLGLYYIKEIVIKDPSPMPGPGPEGNPSPDDGIYEYIAVKQFGFFEVVKSLLVSFDPTGGALSGILFAAVESMAGFVGGNSFTKISLLDLSITALEAYAEDKLVDNADDILRSIIGKKIPIVSGVVGAITFVNSMASSEMVTQYDGIIFKLLDIGNAEMRSSEIEDIVTYMNRAYDFVAENSAYFFGSMTVTKKERSFLGNISVTTVYGESMWEYDISLYNAKKEKKIKSLKSDYFSEIMCVVNTNFSKLPANAVYEINGKQYTKAAYINEFVKPTAWEFVDGYSQRLTNLTREFLEAVFGEDKYGG